MSVRVAAFAAMGMMAVAAVVVVAGVYGTLRALVTTAPSAQRAPSPAPDDNADALDRAVATIEGRSLFFVPEPPPAAPVREIASKADDAAAPPPVYDGPELIAMFAGAAWFGDGSRYAPGEGEQGRLHVVRLNPPWEAVVEWRGAEFTLNLFERDEVVFPEPTEELSRASVALDNTTREAP